MYVEIRSLLVSVRVLNCFHRGGGRKKMLNELLSRRLESISDDGANVVTTTMTIGSEDNVRVDAVDARNEDRRTNRNLMLRNMLQNVHVGHVEKDSYESKTNNDEDDEPVVADESDEMNNNNEDALNLKTCVDEDNADKMDVDGGNQHEFAESYVDDKNKENCLDKPTPNEEKYVSSSPESDVFDDDLDDVSTVDDVSSPPPASRLQLTNVEPTEQKRARVENIVSGMRSSPLPSVNGCKKRKLYQPQQQHPLANFRYRKCDVDINDEEVDCRRQKENEKDALESQMRAMQERLNEMEREYTQLRDVKVKVDDYDDYEEAFSPKKKTRLHSPATTPLSRTPASSPFKESINGGGLTSPRNMAVNKDKQHSRRDKNCWRVNDCNGAAARYSQHRKQHYFNDVHFDSSDIAHREFQASVKTQANHGKRTGVNNQSHHRAVKVSDFSRSSSNKTPIVSSVSSECFDLEGLADALKSEITLTLTNLIDIIVTRFVQQQRVADKDGDEAARTAEQLNKDLMLASQLLDRKLPRSKAVIGRENPFNDKEQSAVNKSVSEVAKLSSSLAKSSIAAQISAADAVAAMKNPAAAAALYSSASCYANSPSGNVFDYTESARVAPEQNEALSLVVPQKKKRHKVTDNRVTPRTVNRILSQDIAASGPPRSPTSSLVNSPTKFESPAASPPRSYPFAHNAPMLPVSLPTSVAIPNPILHESRVYSPYNIFYEQRRPPSSSPPAYNDQSRDASPPPPALGHHTIFHSALMTAGTPQQQQQRSHNQRRKGSSSPDYTGTSIDCNSMEYDGMTPTLSTLSPLHLRKAKLMFFWVRYPNPTVLKMYFPDVKFNKQNSAQLVKWFSNFREFYYSSIEKCARTELANGRKDANDLHVSNESKIYEDLNMHYNRNQHIQVPSNFRYVVEQTLKEIFKVIQAGKDKETSWKKPIYKIIGALDDQVPEYFKLQSFLDQLA